MSTKYIVGYQYIIHEIYKATFIGVYGINDDILGFRFNGNYNIGFSLDDDGIAYFPNNLIDVPNIKLDTKELRKQKMNII